MTVRVLSLFDDDDFLPEKPNKNISDNKPDNDSTKDNIETKTNDIVDASQGVKAQDITTATNIINIELPPEPTNTNSAPEVQDITINNNLDNLYKEAIILTDYTQFTQFEDDIIAQANSETTPDKLKDNNPNVTHNDFSLTENFVFEETPAPRINTTPKETQDQAQDLPEWVLDKKYYGISEVAKLFNVNISHIRFWTNEFKLKVRTNKKGDRLYSPENITLLRKIYHLVKVKKHTIKGAQEILKNKPLQVDEELSLKDSLESLKKQLLVIRSNL